MRIIMFLLCLLIFDVCSGQKLSIDLNQNWEFLDPRTSKWFKAEVPGTIHTDLLANGLIPDPFYRDNEMKVQWVENENWKYKLEFIAADKIFTQKYIDLVFEGLDGYARVLLNGKLILFSNNMFLGHRVDVKPSLKKGKNKLEVHFLPQAWTTKNYKASQSVVYPENERAFIRKAQYQFGWDWGPRLVTCGIWKNVRIEACENGQRTQTSSKTWNVELERKKDSIGESFRFTKQGIPIYIKGANWIPADNFLPRAKKIKRYEQLIKAAKEANINMLRVWGGGIYEDDVFYELCDQYGIMVWQDFMFAGALYPGDEAFIKNVEAEVRYQVTRLRSHPCIVIWCGNNEIEEAWFNWGWQKQYNYSSSDSTRLWNDYKKIFHQLIPSVLKELDPSRPYWPSSPSLGWGRDSAYKQGDVHYWGVWWGKEPVEKYYEKVGRFNSEYGMQGMPDMKTIRQFALPEDFDTSSKVLKVHQKHPFGYENIKMYIQNKFREPKTFEDLVYVSQLMQADAIRTAIEAHRSNPKNNGTMFWQWNDCWPVTSWSAIDYYGRKKALYYEVKRSFADSVLFIQKKENGFEVGVLTDVQDSNNLVSSIQLVPFNTDSSNHSWRIASPPPAQFTFIPFTKFLKSGLDSATVFSNYYIEYSIHGKDQLTVAKAVLMTDPKKANLPNPVITWQKSVLFNDVIEVMTDKFAYGVYIDVPDGVELDDNYFNLVPGTVKYVKLTTTLPFEKIKDLIKIKSLADTYK